MKIVTKLGMYSTTHDSRGQRKKKNADGTKKQSECRIRYRALREKKKHKKNKRLNFVSLSSENEKYILKKYIASTSVYILHFVYPYI